MRDTRYLRRMLATSSENPTSLTADLRRGDETQILGILQGCGVGVEDLLMLKENSGDNPMVASLMEVFFHYCLFTPPHEQWRFYDEINEAVWHNPYLTKESVWNHTDALLWGEEYPRYHRIDPPKVPMIHEGGIYCATLVFDFANPLVTLQHYLQACAYVFSKVLKFSKFVIQDEIAKEPEFSFVPGCEPKATDLEKPRFRWLVTELGRMTRFGLQPHEYSVKPTKNHVGLELLMIAAMHPRWAISLGQGISPWPAASGVTIDGQHLILGCSGPFNGDLRLMLREDKGRGRNCLPLQTVGWVTEVTQI